MKLNTSVLFLFAISFRICEAQTEKCPCGETIGSSHERESVKNRSAPASLTLAISVTVSGMKKWKIFTDDLSNEQGHIYPREGKLYTLKGYIMLAKISPDDCDIHLEIASTQDTAADRIIAEISNTDEYCALRKKIFDSVRAKLNKRLGTAARRFNASTGFIKLTLTGYAFFDQSHYSYTNLKKGHSHGSRYVATIWEIHPVVKLEIK